MKFDRNTPFDQADDIEFASPEEIAGFQNRQLRSAMKYLESNSPFYQRMMKAHGFTAADVNSVEDLQRLPFTEKADLQLYNSDFLCVEPRKVVDYITTSGTLGDPVTFGCTDADLDRLAYNEHKSFACAGVTESSTVQLMTTLDKRFMAGMAYFLGLRRMGAGVVRVGNGMPQLQWDTIGRLQPDTLMCVPSFILRLVEYAEAHGIDYRNSSVKRIIGIGEGLREADFSLNLLGRRIAEKWPVELYATYSSTEMGATFSECSHGCGGHVHPELIIVEIIGDDDRPVPDGTPGEVVVTTLGVEGMPLLRFRTGDIAAKITAPCACGRNSYRLTPLIGRKNNMIKLKGTTLYPPAINDVLDNTPYVVNYVVEVRDSAAGTDEVVVKVGVASAPAINVVKDLKDRFRSRIRVAPIVEIMDPDDVAAINFANNSRKPIKFIDLRKKP
ncbi:MAG: AMP-binding protein [Muribaculaceae bacterium]|nr:AMP-binding protein [Muribaculaceae bacterium]MDE5968291.1 AMP-binding protein [Muribaculaceae bacterium]